MISEETLAVTLPSGRQVSVEISIINTIDLNLHFERCARRTEAGIDRHRRRIHGGRLLRHVEWREYGYKVAILPPFNDKNVIIKDKPNIVRRMDDPALL